MLRCQLARLPLAAVTVSTVSTRMTHLFAHLGCAAEIRPLLVLFVSIVVGYRVFIPNRMKECQ